MVTLANLLHSCPMVRDLRLKLSRGLGSRLHFFKSKECQADFDKSVSNFRRQHRKKQMVFRVEMIITMAMMRVLVSLS